MRLYADSTGRLMQWRPPTDEPIIPTPPAGAAHVLDFDHTTNAALIAAVVQSWSTARLVDGTLAISSQTIAVQPPSQAYSDRQSLSVLFDKLSAEQSLTTAELRRALRLVLGQMIGG